MLLETSVCLLTGATGGIGSALARRLAEQGVKLIISGRSTEKLAALSAHLKGEQSALCVPADLTKEVDRARLSARACAEGVNLVINCSGVNSLGLLDDQALDVLEQTMALNVIAPIRLTQLMLPHLKSLESACIVNVGSALGNIGHPGYTTYCASKFALRGFSEALGRELDDTSIDVVHISPRATSTQMNSSRASALNKALGTKEDDPMWVADRVIEAIKKRTKSSVIGWPEKFYAQLNQCLPGLVDRSMAKKLGLVKKYASQKSAQH